MSTEEVDSLRKNLDDNPPQAFNIARRMTVFNSHFEFAELELTGVNIARKRVRIPNHLLGVADERTRDQLRSQFQVVAPDSKMSGKALRQDRELIARRFLTVIPNYGSVVRRKEKSEFIEQVDKLRGRVTEFKTKLESELQESMEKSLQALVKALLPGLKRKPPKSWCFSDGTRPDRAAVRTYLEEELRQAFGPASRLLSGMSVRLRFKGVTYETLDDHDFLSTARRAGLDVDRLHEEFQVARAIS